MKSALQRRLQQGFVYDAVVMAFLFFLCLLFFWQVLTPNPLNRLYFASGDFTDQFYAFRYYQAQELWNGRLPVWNPHTFSGSPFLADIQSAVYYPIGLLVILLFGKSGLPLIAVEIEAILHYFLASLFTYLLVKRLTGSRLAGLISGAAYAYGSYLTSYPKLQMAILEGQTWVPLALLAVHRAAEAEGQRRVRQSNIWLMVGGAGLALSAMAGHGQTLLLAVYTVLAYLIFAFFPIWWGFDRRGKVRLVARLLILPLFALGLSATQLIPSIEYMLLSTRAQMSFAQAGGGFIYSDLPALILPGLRIIYVGILPLILALVALVLRRDRHTLFWGILALLALLLSLGRQAALFTFFYILAPGFRLFQGQERALQVFGLAVAILAGYGAALLVRPMNRQQKHRFAALFRLLVWANVGAWVLVLLAYWGAANLAPPESGQVNDLLERSVLLALLLGLSTLALRLRLGHRLRSGRLGLVLIPIILFDLFTLNFGSGLQGDSARDRFLVTSPVRFLQDQPGIFRVWSDVLPGNFGCVWGLEEIGGISPLRLQRYDDLLSALPGERARQLLNVHYAVSWRQALSDGEIVAEYSDPANELYVHRILDPGPAAYVVYEAEVVTDDAKALQRLASSELDPHKTAVLAENPTIALSGTGTGTAQFVQRLPNYMALEVETSADGILVLSEVLYPGWRARVDGHPARILRADFTLRAVEVPAGKHTVEMVFDPVSVKAGLAISATALLLCLAYGLWQAIGHVRARPGP